MYYNKLIKEQKTEMTDFKQVLMTNPYRKTREISYLAFEKVKFYSK